MSIDPSTIVVFESNGSDWAVAYIEGERAYTGHIDDVRERIIYDLGIKIEYPSGRDFFQTRRGDETELDAIEGAYARMKEIES